MIQVHAFLFDDENEEKFAAHGIRRAQVAQVLDEDPLIVVNRRGAGLPIS